MEDLLGEWSVIRGILVEVPGFLILKIKNIWNHKGPSYCILSIFNLRCRRNSEFMNRKQINCRLDIREMEEVRELNFVKDDKDYIFIFYLLNGVNDGLGCCKVIVLYSQR